VRSELIPVRRLRRAAASLACVVILSAGSGCAPKGSGVVVVTTNDVMGKTSPCGCHTPKGGLARRAAFVDSVRTRHGDVLVLDAGGFFPSSDLEREAAPFMLDEMKRMGTRAAGVGASELRFGYAFARELSQETGVPLLCANLLRRDGDVPAFEATRLFDVKGVRVGVFGLLREDTDLGRARDSLRLAPALTAARDAVIALRAQGAQVVVALAQLGRAASESLAVEVHGIDLVVSGGGVPVDEQSVQAGQARVLHGGSQGWSVGLAEARLDASGHPRWLQARTIELGPDVRTDPAVAERVHVFEDSLNARLRARQVSFAAALIGKGSPRYLGQAGCVDCHQSQYAQWRTTAHARAWRTLEDLNKESTPRCVACHVTGLGEPGGFQTMQDAARLGDVQCEACHGMGTEHPRWKEKGSRIAESACRSCHTRETSPTFSFATYRSHVLHDPPPDLQPLPLSPAKRQMQAGREPHAH